MNILLRQSALLLLHRVPLFAGNRRRRGEQKETTFRGEGRYGRSGFRYVAGTEVPRQGARRADCPSRLSPAALGESPARTALTPDPTLARRRRCTPAFACGTRRIAPLAPNSGRGGPYQYVVCVPAGGHWAEGLPAR